MQPLGGQEGKDYNQVYSDLREKKSETEKGKKKRDNPVPGRKQAIGKKEPGFLKETITKNLLAKRQLSETPSVEWGVTGKRKLCLLERQ